MAEAGCVYVPRRYNGWRWIKRKVIERFDKPEARYVTATRLSDRRIDMVRVERVDKTPPIIEVMREDRFDSYHMPLVERLPERLRVD